MGVKTTGNRRKLTCLCCLVAKPFDKFPMSAFLDKYSRLCSRCSNEEKETEQYIKEQQNDPDYHAYMRQHYNK